MSTCEDFELELGAPELSADVRAHLAQCSACRETYEVVALAALPEVTAAERAALVGLAPATLAEWQAQGRRRSRVSWVVSLAVAAGLGAVVATGVMWRLRPEAQPVAAATRTVEPVLLLDAPVVPELSADALNVSDDDVFFEVSWPSATEGDL
jgi:predicted anti-sigma-YlaC factor YlaD